MKRNDNKLLIASLGFAALILTGCIDTNDDDDNSTSSGTLLLGNKANSSIQGTWGSGCTYDPEIESYSKDKLTVSGNNATMISNYYSDASCSMAEMRLTLKGNLKIGSEIILTSGETVNKIDITVTSKTLALQTSQQAEGFNSRSTCGKTDWQENIEVDISSCADLDSPNQFFDIFKVENNRLRFGDDSTGEGTSDNTRPTQLGTDFLIKQ